MLFVRHFPKNLMKSQMASLTTNNTNKIRLQDIKELCESFCKIKDPESVELKINAIIDGGLNRLQTVFDFDQTITKQHTETGSKIPSSFGMFNQCESIPSEFLEQSNILYEKYHPIEIDPHLSIDEKRKYMIEWWEEINKMLKNFPFNLKELDVVTAKYKDCLRDRTQILFEKLHNLNIPVLVFSAGLGNSVLSVLEQTNILYDNVEVISNFLQFKNGLVNGFGVPFIHTFNKNEHSIEGRKFHDIIRSRDHVILAGDSIGDANMAEGVADTSHIIKIGFLYNHIEENLEKYMNTFDIVLIDDQTMDVVLKLITIIENSNKAI